METINSKSSKGSILYLQNLLIERGYSIVKTGDYDRDTRSAIVDFQRNNQLDADGIIGYKSWEALLLSGRRIGGRLTESDSILGAQLLDVEVVALKAVQQVETQGRGGFFAPGKPAILFEGHIFWRELIKRGINPEIYVKGNENILYSVWTKKHYYGGIREYERLERARNINRDAANASASWGMFQILGNNYAACGEKSVESFVNTMCENEFMQLLLTVRFIRQKGLQTALKEKRWVEFAKGYNGVGYQENKYDIKLAEAYAGFI